jgi:hypothetical protein
MPNHRARIFRPLVLNRYPKDTAFGGAEPRALKPKRERRDLLLATDVNTIQARCAGHYDHNEQMVPLHT